MPVAAQSFSMVPRLPPVPPERLCCSLVPAVAAHSFVPLPRLPLPPPRKALLQLPPTVPQAFCSVWFRDCRLPSRKALLQLPPTLPQAFCSANCGRTILYGSETAACPPERLCCSFLPQCHRPSAVPTVAAQSFVRFRNLHLPPRKALLQLPSTVPQALYSASCGRAVLHGSETVACLATGFLQCQLWPQCHRPSATVAAQLYSASSGRAVLLHGSECQLWPHNRIARFRDCRLPGHRLSTVPAVAAQSFCMVPRLPPAPRKALLQLPSTAPQASVPTVPQAFCSAHSVATQSFCTVPRLPPGPAKGSAAASFHSATGLLQCQAFYSASASGGRTILLYGSETVACLATVGSLQCQLWPHNLL